MVEVSVESLVEAARAGDRVALEKLLENEQSRIYRYSMKMCRHPEDAADVLQETLLTMARTLKDFRGESSLSTWLYTIARSYCGRKRRRSKFAPEREDSLESEARPEVLGLADPANGPEEEASGREVRIALDRAIGSLEPMYREVLMLRDVEGLSAKEVGEVLALTVPAVKSRLHRARSVVRDQMAAFFNPEAELPGADCPDIAASLSRHLEGELNPDACAQMERHIETCGGCKATCDSLKETLRLCRASPTPAVPAAIATSVRIAITRYLTERD